MTRYQLIGDYALIGDCRSAGLVSRDGSLDWLCLPRFDSPSIFAALLDGDDGGRFRIRPTGEYRTTRRYLPDTNIVETTFQTPAGTFVLRDLMAVGSAEENSTSLTPDHEILREIEGINGEVDIEVLYEPRPDYGRGRPALEVRGALGVWCQSKHGVLVLCSDLPVQVDSSGRTARGVGRIRSGERKYCSLTHAEHSPALIPPLGAVAQAKVERSSRWWQRWAAQCTYQGPYRAAVVRSAMALKLMAYAPSGAVIAAPTTSLPEKLGGVRNWDYRYCWLRDASFTLRSLLSLGYGEEASAFFDWMLQATRLTWPKLQVVYSVFGEARLPEQELPHLEGYKGSRPVRRGNGAHAQVQLDVYGEVIDAAARFAAQGGNLDRDSRRMLIGLGQTVCKRWRDPDDGIWEARSGRFQHTHSKVLCWVALDRLVKMHESGRLRAPIEQFRTQRDLIRSEIEARGYSEQLQSYTSVFGGDDLDASLLTLPLYGYVEAGHPRMRATYTRIVERLGEAGLVYRYGTGTDDGLPAGEGAFGICSFWAVECLALAGEVEAATRAFEHLCSYANDVGLLGEEIDPNTDVLLGNFPQAFTHVGLINAALTLAECRAEHVGGVRT
jgi:GH15 family glucan-1,4-alpha-glucosidase